MAGPTRNPFFAARETRRTANSQRVRAHAFVVATLALAILAVAVTGTLSQVA